MTAALVFNVAANYVPVLLAHYILFGARYGIIVFAVMNFVVLPLSALPPRPFALAIAIWQLLIHIFFVGLPISIAAHSFASK